MISKSTNRRFPNSMFLKSMQLFRKCVCVCFFYCAQFLETNAGLSKGVVFVVYHWRIKYCHIHKRYEINRDHSTLSWKTMSHRKAVFLFFPHQVSSSSCKGSDERNSKNHQTAWWANLDNNKNITSEPKISTHPTKSGCLEWGGLRTILWSKGLFFLTCRFPRFGRV